MKELKLKIVCIFSVCLFATCLNVSAAEPQQSKTSFAPSRAVVTRDIQKEFMLMGVPPISPVVISGVPDYLWRHGCGPTAVGNVVGYYDSHGYDDLITGDANTQTYDTNQAMASGGDSGNPNPAGSEKHYEDYARPEDSSPGPLLTDDYITQGRIAHTNDCIGDYQDTSKSTRNNYYGWSWSTDIGPSFTGYVNQKNASYNPTYTEYSPVSGTALTWAVLTNEINNNRPMVFLVDSDGDGSTDHFVCVVGYDAQTNQYGCYDSWMPAGIRWETFQGIGNGAFSIWGGWSFQLGQQSGPVTKWEQPPDVTPYGIDVRFDRRAGVQRTLADDFPCTASGPITKVRLWGSWKNDIKGDIQSIHLSIHSDDPIGPGGTDPQNIYSKPDQLLWSRDFIAANITESLFLDITPEYEWWWDPCSILAVPNGDHKIWLYEITIEPNVAFRQQGSPTNQVVYWLDAYAMLGPNVPSSQFGWKTSMQHWNDDGVWSIDNGTTWNELRYPPNHPLASDSVDLAFGIVTQTEPNIEPNYPNAKWLQRPDLSTNGVDVKATEPSILADDFECRQSTLITDITIWGSWKYDMLPQEGVTNVPFSLSIHSDIPAIQSPTGYSMPNDVLWHGTFLPSEVSIERENIDEGWFDPSINQYIFPGDHVCWKYVFHIPEANAFCQKGEPNSPKIYWLDVQAHPNPTAATEFGWKSSINHWNDDAVWTLGGEPYIGIWQELRYPPGHPLEPQSIDLAFAIDGNIPCNMPEADLGDAPDSTNNYGVAMTAYPPLAIGASFPTVYLTGSPPFGPIHRQPLGVAWLGPNVTLENEADIGPDQDPTNNIIPLINTPDRDVNDDGVLNLPLMLPHCRLTTFQYLVNVVNPAVALYANVWFDWNCDGDWDDVPACSNSLAPEWAVQNQLLAAGSLAVGLNTVTTPQFRPWHLTTYDSNALWMRITLSEQPWASSGSGGSGPPGGYYYGETEDYYFNPIVECMKSTAPEYATWVSWGRPDCWCCKRQCRGDADCTKTGPAWVSTPDLNLLKAAYGKNDVVLRTIIIGGVPGICADFDHQKTGPARVSTPDLAILKLYYGKGQAQVPCCDLDMNCVLQPEDKWNFWTD